MLSIKLFLQSKKYFASAFLFTCFSLIFSTWVTYIPHISEKIKISEGQIGQALFFSAIGSLLMIKIAKYMVDKIGVGKNTYFSLIAYCFSFYGPFLAYNYLTLCIALFVFGMASSSYAISLNSLTATIEKQDRVYIMSGSHGFWSLGGMIGAATGSFLAALLHNPLIHVTIIIFIILFIQTKLKSQYYFRKNDQETIVKSKNRNLKPLYIIALIGVITMVSEGAIADWSALYLKKIMSVNIKYIGLGYAAFSLAMMIGRFYGDAMSKRLGSWQLITVSSFIGLLGFLMILIYNPILAIMGFFVVGLGFSVVVPEVYRLAGNVEGLKTTDGVSFIAASTNIGFMMGPVILGYIAELDSLHLSFTFLTIFVFVGFLISFWKFKKKECSS